MAAFLDGCKFTAVSSGTVDFVVSAAVLGAMTPVQANAANARAYKYYAASLDKTQWEFGEGNYTVGSVTLARTTILFSSTGGAKVSFTTPPVVALVALKEDLISIEEANSFTTAQKLQARTNIGVDFMTASSHFWDSSQIKTVTTDQLNATGSFVTLTDAATIAWDNFLGINFTVTLAGSRTLGNMTNPVVGRSGMLEVVQNGTGGFTLSLGANYKTDIGGGFTIDTVASRKNGILYFVRSATEVWLSLPFKGVR